MRDDFHVRIGAEARYNLVIGGGDGYLVDLRAMHGAGLDADKPAHEDHDDGEIQRLRDRGVIAGDSGPDDENTAYTYIRHRRGCGASDDACAIMCGPLHGSGAGVDAFLADAVDTLEKYVPVFGGQDGAIAERIEREMPDLGVSRRDVEHIIYLCADESHSVPDSSLRRLLSVDRRTDLCAAESPLLYLLGRPVGRIGLGRERASNTDFYAPCEARSAAWKGRMIAANRTA